MAFAFLPPEHDPDSYVRDLGKEAFQAAIDRATPLSEFLLQTLTSHVDLTSAEGRAKLKAYGIAPPGHLLEHGQGVAPIRIVRRGSALESVPCPHCDSADTERLSAFGATACKSLWRCRTCREPFEHFKPI